MRGSKGRKEKLGKLRRGKYEEARGIEEKGRR